MFKKETSVWNCYNEKYTFNCLYTYIWIVPQTFLIVNTSKKTFPIKFDGTHSHKFPSSIYIFQTDQLLNTIFIFFTQGSLKHIFLVKFWPNLSFLHYFRAVMANPRAACYPRRRFFAARLTVWFFSPIL